MEIARSRQDADVAWVAMGRVARQLGVGDDVGAGQLDVGIMIL
jgi:hypothetical protein